MRTKRFYALPFIFFAVYFLMPQLSVGQTEIQMFREDAGNQAEGNKVNNKTDNSKMAVSLPDSAAYNYFSKKRRIDAQYLQVSLNKGMKAAPVNDNICSAIALPLNGTCLTGQTNIDATPDWYGGCVNSGYSSVWYEFTPSGTNDMVTITFDNVTFGNNVEMMLLDGTCLDPSGISTQCDDAASTTFEFSMLVPGTTYYLLVSTAPGGGNEGNFDICATESVSPPLVNGPEQDCYGALPVCNGTLNQTVAYEGFGDISEIGIGQTCLFGGENNSVWYVFTIQPPGGNISFMINSAADYDFALWNITNGGCDIVQTTSPVRCNYSDNPGNTGLTTSLSPELPALANGWMNSATMDGISGAAAGQTYALFVDNWTGDASGYVLDFGSSPLVDNPPATGEFPYMISAVPSCSANTILITMNENIKCLTVSASDFTLTNTTTSTDYTGAITEIIGYNCPVTDGAMTNQILITHDGSLISGSYRIDINSGPVLADKCDNIILETEFITFNYLADLTLTASSATICDGNTVNLDAGGIDLSPPAHTYTLNPGGLTNTGNGQFNGLTPSSATTYTVEVTYGGCTKSAQTFVDVQSNIIVSVNPVNPTICAGSTTLTASTTMDGVACGTCTFLWSTTETTASISAAGGDPGLTYTVTSQTPEGCTSDNVGSSTVSFASAGSGGSCDVLYVDNYNSSTDDGLTKTTPTSLIDALTKALCTNTIIKMAAGTYNLNNRVLVNSYVTIEGGYINGFTQKSSDLSGSAETTIIRRNNTADSDDANGCTAFKIPGGEINFRFQDIRIELPGSPSVAGHADGSEMTNYGIRIEAGCSGYKIVRCDIQAGNGSNP